MARLQRYLKCLLKVDTGKVLTVGQTQVIVPFRQSQGVSSQQPIPIVDSRLTRIVCLTNHSEISVVSLPCVFHFTKGTIIRSRVSATTDVTFSIQTRCYCTYLIGNFNVYIK